MALKIKLEATDDGVCVHIDGEKNLEHGIQVSKAIMGLLNEVGKEHFKTDKDIFKQIDRLEFEHQPHKEDV